MMNSKLAQPYAKAAFEYALEHKELDKWAKILQTLTHLVEQPEVEAVLNSPLYSADIKTEILFALVEDQLDQHSRNFIRLLTSNRRLSLLPAIAAQYEDLKASIEQMVTAVVKSAIVLSEDYKKQLTTELGSKLGRRVILNCQVEPDLLGGLLVIIGDRVMDGTIKGQLQRLRETVVR